MALFTRITQNPYVKEKQYSVAINEEVQDLVLVVNTMAKFIKN